MTIILFILSLLVKSNMIHYHKKYKIFQFIKCIRSINNINNFYKLFNKNWVNNYKTKLNKMILAVCLMK